MSSNRIVIWYSDQTKEYYLHSEEEIFNKTTKYQKDFDHILYAMENDQLSIATKIKDRLNQARGLAP